MGAAAVNALPYPAVTWHSNGDGDHWRLYQPYSLRFPAAWSTTLKGVDVPAGFRFDLASIPRLFRWFCEPYELSILAPLVHDFLYRNHATTRAEADRLLRLIANEQGVGWWRRNLAYWAVRLFGWLAWRSPDKLPPTPAA